jgi:hypothetical protein
MAPRITGAVKRLAESQRRYARLNPVPRADQSLDPAFFGRPFPGVCWGLTLNK